jgi:hypothetical protein
LELGLLPSFRRAAPIAREQATSAVPPRFPVRDV